MAWDEITKRGLITQYVDIYFKEVDQKTRDSVSGMSQPTLETERFALEQSLDRQHTLGVNAQKDITRLRIMEFVTQCNGMSLDPGEDRDAQRQMHQKLQLFAEGKMSPIDANTSLRHEKRMGARSKQIAARDSITFKVN